MAILTPEQHEAISARPGWCGPNKRELIAQSIADLGKRLRRPLECLEIGVYGGQSLLAAAFAIQATEHKGRLVGVDPYLSDAGIKDKNAEDSTVWWGGSEQPPNVVLAETLDIIESHRLSQIVSIWRQRSSEAVDKVPGLDYLHIDGDHSEASARLDWELYSSKLTKGSIVVIDDTDWPGVKAILPAVRERCKRLCSSGKIYPWSAWELYEVR